VIWIEKFALSVLRQNAYKLHHGRDQKRKSELYRIAKHFPVIMTRLIAQKRSQTVLQMGIDLYYLKKLACAIKIWSTVALRQIKITQCLERALSLRRQKVIHEYIVVLKRHAQRAVRTQIQTRTAYLHHKVKMFRQFVRGIRLMQRQSMQMDTSTSMHRTETIDTYSVLAASAKFLMSHHVGAVANSTRAPRYVLFRDRLYHKKTSLLQQWRSCIQQLSIQREARLWGTRW